MSRALRSAAAGLVLAGALSIAGAAAFAVAAAPSPTTRVFPPADRAPAAAVPLRVEDVDFLGAGYLERDPLPEDVATVNGHVLDRSMRLLTRESGNPRRDAPPRQLLTARAGPNGGAGSVTLQA
jgi:hypothetical protein